MKFGLPALWSLLKTAWKFKAVQALTAICAILFLCYLAFFNFTEQYEAGLAWNMVTGELSVQTGSIHLTAPWVTVSRIDTRPQRVCVTSESRAFNCKLVRFVPTAYKEFVATEGHRYYWWSNRFSFNSGYKDEYRGMKDVLRGYAYSTQPYPFVEVTQEMPQP